MAGKKDKLVIQKAKGRITPEQELATDSVIYRLGDTPAYAHTYVRFMKAGTKTAAEKLDNAVGRYVRSVKQIMKDQIENLDTREKQLYKLLKIQTFTEFRKV